MVENDSDDEYQLNDPDALTLESDNAFDMEPDNSSVKAGHESPDFKRIIRHGLIVIGAIFLLLFLYKVVGTYLSNKQSNSSEIEITPAPAMMSAEKQVQTKPLPLLQKSTPIKTQASQLVTNEKNIVPEPQDKQLSVLEQQQQTMSTQVIELNTQLSTLSSTMNDMTSKVAVLNQMIVNLNEKIDTQSSQLLSMQKKKVENVRSRTFASPSKQHATSVVRYYLQAVIPGRAWLVAENGTTLTVREGSTLVGYGFIRSIDTKQGRVFTSSGKTIKFSQADS